MDIKKAPELIDLSKYRMYKMSMGIFKKEASTERKDRRFPRNTIEEFILNKHWVVMDGTTNRNQAERFMHEAKIGDYIYLTTGQYDLYGIYEFTSDAKPIPKEELTWVNQETAWWYREVKLVFDSVVKDATNLSQNKKGWLPSGFTTFHEIPRDQLTTANELLFKPKYNVELIIPDELEDIELEELAAQDKEAISKNRILYGPPGTGKTYQTIELALQIVLPADEYAELDSLNDRSQVKACFDRYVKKGQIQFVTFHQSMSYEDFVEGIKPQLHGEQISYEIQDGIFKQICTLASTATQGRVNYLRSEEAPVAYRGYKQATENYVLIIDEINRGNIAATFGELITLIEEDKRLGAKEAMEVVLPYSKQSFSVPQNLYIIGTMNTADRSVEALDSALRRRFNFIEMPPQPDLITSRGLLKGSNGKIEKISLSEILHTINQRIEVLLDKDHAIGHSYFLLVKDLNDLRAIFQNQIIPLLQEYFFGDYGKIGLVLGEGFVRKKAAGATFATFDYNDAHLFSSAQVYEIISPEKQSEEDFIQAIHTLLGQETHQADHGAV